MARRSNANLFGRKSALRELGETFLGERYPQREARNLERPKRTKKTGESARSSEGWSREESEKALRAWNKKYGRNNPPPCAVMRKDDVTDRAKRYRANQPGCMPDGARQCDLCPSRDDLMVDHKDGNEDNGRRSNLRWLCRSCNTRLGALMAKQGKGRRTKQFNAGAKTLGEYAQAVATHTRGAHDASGLVIHQTSKAKRSEFAREIADIRRSRGNPGEDEAASLSEAWSGTPASAATDYVDTVRYEDKLSDCGRLRELKVYVTDRAVKAIKFDKNTRLGIVPRGDEGQQAYVVGGDQSLSESALAEFDVSPDEYAKDLIPVGTCYSVTYDAKKPHLEGGAEYGPWEHKFAEEGGVEPEILYDRLNAEIRFAGGSYRILRDIDGKYSAGIRD